MASTTYITLSLFMVASYAANLGCNGVEYEISGNSYFEPVNACVNNVVYFCDGDVLKRKACALTSNPRYDPDMGAFTTDESTITTDVCNAITTEKSANACQTYCDGESCPAVVKTEYPIIPYDMQGCSGQEYCIRDSQQMCSFYWQTDQPLFDITGGAASQTAHMTGRCVDSSVWSCVYTTRYFAHKTHYSQPDCTGEATTTLIFKQCPYTDDTSSTSPAQPITYGCYVYRTASPTGVPTASTKAPSASPTSTTTAPSAPSAPPTTTAPSVPSAPPSTNAPSAPSAPPTSTAPSAPSAPPTTSEPTATSKAPSKAPSEIPTFASSDEIASDESQGSGSAGLDHNLVHVLCTILFVIFY
eukprot:647690_1